MTIELPSVSVIILGFNGQKYIDDCLGSVFEQDYPLDKYEVIWADNCSTDEFTSTIKYKYPRVRIIQFEKNFGFAEGNNQAIKYSHGECVIFLNQDTIVHSLWLRNLVQALLNNPTLVACQSNMLMPWADEFSNLETKLFPRNVYFTEINSFGFVEYKNRPLSKVDKVLKSNFLTGASFIIRRDVLENIMPLFDQKLGSYSEDLELSLRLARLGYSYGVAGYSVVYHLQNMKVKKITSVVKKAYLANRNRYFAYYKNLPFGEFMQRLPKMIIGSPLKSKRVSI